MVIPVGELTTAVSSGISGSNRQGSELRLGSTGTGNAWGRRRWHTQLNITATFEVVEASIERVGVYGDRQGAAAPVVVGNWEE